MTIQTNPVLQHGTELSIPLSKLKTSPRNARRTRHSEADIATLAASIEAKGVLQPPVVEPELDRTGAGTGSYLVTIGEGRRQALRLLAKRKVIAKDAPIRCLLDTMSIGAQSGPPIGAQKGPPCRCRRAAWSGALA